MKETAMNEKRLKILVYELGLENGAPNE